MTTALTLPLTADRARALRAGEQVSVTGRVLTASEAAHRLLAERLDPGVRAVAEGRLLYHCRPVIAPDRAGGWRVLAAGPSPSARVEPWAPAVIARLGVCGILGKGGPGETTRTALRARGAVYLQAAAALAVTLARRVLRVHGVHLLGELGPTDAMWDLEVDGFPAVVTLDARGAAPDLRLEAASAGAAL